MNLTESIRLALRSIRGNKLRSFLTLFIITLGIMALIGILTATEGIKYSMLNNFREMGSNTFGIRNEGTLRKAGPKGRGRREKSTNPVITFQQSQEFKKTFKYPSVISISINAEGNSIVRYASKKSNPNVRVFGADENYLQVSGLNIAQGRNFTKNEVDNAQAVALIGKDVIAKVYLPSQTVVGSLLTVGDNKFRIVGILASKGASQNSSDNQVIITHQAARRIYPVDNNTFMINVMVPTPEELNAAIDEATGVMRNVRRLKLADEPDFDITRSERLAGQILDQLKYVKYATIVIGILTLLGAGIGLMNIMLVSVNERTREIGISKALGATKKVIRMQFLTEAIVICQIGGMLGIILGVLLGNIVGLITQSGFLMPWMWVGLGITFTFIVGLAAGLYPAFKASELDPVEALRYE